MSDTAAVFNDDFGSVEDIETQFSAPGCLAGCTVLYASYTYEDYSGDARVVYADADGDLFEVVSGHCSCNGLEGTWEPDAITAEALAIRPDDVSKRLARALGVDTERAQQREIERLQRESGSERWRIQHAETERAKAQAAYNETVKRLQDAENKARVAMGDALKERETADKLRTIAAARSNIVAEALNGAVTISDDCEVICVDITDNGPAPRIVATVRELREKARLWDQHMESAMALLA